MLGLAQTQPVTPAAQRLFAPWPASHHSSLDTHHCLIQSLAKHNRKPSQIIENNHQRPKSIASFCRVFRNSNGQSRNAGLPPLPVSPCTRRQILIATAPELKIHAND
jgi:hypothetical protein